MCMANTRIAPKRRKSKSIFCIMYLYGAVCHNFYQYNHRFEENMALVQWKILINYFKKITRLDIRQVIALIWNF
jgi:hypothetical protein